MGYHSWCFQQFSPLRAWLLFKWYYYRIYEEFLKPWAARRDQFDDVTAAILWFWRMRSEPLLNRLMLPCCSVCSLLKAWEGFFFLGKKRTFSHLRLMQGDISLLCSSSTGLLRDFGFWSWDIHKIWESFKKLLIWKLLVLFQDLITEQGMCGGQTKIKCFALESNVIPPVNSVYFFS